MHCHFLLQIVQANCSILPDGLCTHSHILTLHTVYSHGHPELPKRVSAQMVSLWKVPGRKSEAESLDFPTPHSPAQLRSPSRFHQHHSRIPVPCLAPHQVPGNQVRYGSQETWENTPAGFRVPWPRLSPGSERFATENLGWFSPKKDPWPLKLPEPCGSCELGTGWVSRALLRSPPCPAHLAKEENLREDGRHVCSSERPAAPPAPALYRWGDHRALEDKQDVVPGGLLPPPWGSHSRGAAEGAAPPWTQHRCLQAGLRRHLSPDLRSQLFLFLLVWPPALEGGTQVLILSQRRQSGSN